MMALVNPVDAVVTWVDGSDKAHAEKLSLHLQKLGIERPIAAAPTRYQQCNEINYCVKSLLRFAPWLRNIFIVTDAQVPPVLKQLENTVFASKIKIIDHQSIFQGLENCMPTFNSLSIESVLWRIQGLSENFIYLNDDAFLLRPLRYEHFFQKKALILRGAWKTPCEQQWHYRFKRSLNHYFKGSKDEFLRNEHRALQERSAHLAGFQKKFFHLPHLPFALKKSTFETFFQEHPQLLSENASYPFRSSEQFWPISLAQHIEIKSESVIRDHSLKAVYLHPGYHSFRKIRSRLAYADRNPAVAFMCMQSLDLAPDATRNFMLNWLDNRIDMEHSS